LSDISTSVLDGENEAAEGFRVRREVDVFEGKPEELEIGCHNFLDSMVHGTGENMVQENFDDLSPKFFNIIFLRHSGSGQVIQGVWP
jgi:hypothetical protein